MTTLQEQRPRIEPTRVALGGHRPRSRTTIHGWAAVLFGTPFLAMGIFIIAMGTGVVPSEASAWHAPRWTGVLAGSLFALAGVWLMGHGLLGVLRRARHESASNAGVEPWLADHPWNPHVILADQPSLTSHVMFPVVVSMFIAIVGSLGESGGESGGFIGGILWIMLGFLGLLWIVGIAFLAHGLLRRLRYGRSRLELEEFPFFLGKKLKARFVAPRGFGEFQSLSFRLRCIEEAYETRGTGDNRSQVVVCYELYKDERATAEAGEITGEFDTTLVFGLPDGLPPTRLSQRPATYWELEVHAGCRGIDYRSFFPLPVYAPAEVA